MGVKMTLCIKDDDDDDEEVEGRGMETRIGKWRPVLKKGNQDLKRESATYKNWIKRRSTSIMGARTVVKGDN